MGDPLSLCEVMYLFHGNVESLESEILRFGSARTSYRAPAALLGTDFAYKCMYNVCAKDPLGAARAKPVHVAAEPTASPGHTGVAHPVSRWGERHRHPHQRRGIAAD